MARHAPDPKTQTLKSQMRDTRRALRVAVKGLSEQGIPEKDIARAAGWSASYLSQFISDTDAAKNPLPAKVIQLIRALHLLSLEKAELRSVHDAIESVATRYELRLAALANPAQPISSDAPNFLARGDVEEFIRSWTAAPGAYFFAGAPAVGLSSALLLAAQTLADQGYKVCRLSVRDDLMIPGLIERSRTGVTGAIAATMLASEAPLELDIYAVEKVIRDCLKSAPRPGYALIVDDIDGIPDKDAQELAAMFNAWKGRRAAGDDGYQRVTVWSAFTSNIVSPTARSWYQPDASTVVRWLGGESELDEMRKLARAFAPRAEQAEAGPDGVELVAENANRHFGGQPQLSHMFLWDRSRDGRSDFVDAAEHVPVGAYAEHLDRISREMIMLLGIRYAQESIDRLSKGEQLPTLVLPHLMERLSVCRTATGGWSCDYYRSHLPGAFEKRAAALELAASRETS
jgi:hypothetical protein